MYEGNQTNTYTHHTQNPDSKSWDTWRVNVSDLQLKATEHVCTISTSHAITLEYLGSARDGGRLDWLAFGPYLEEIKYHNIHTVTDLDT